MIKSITKCPITNSEEKITYFDLGMMPLVNNLNSCKEESLQCPRYPLAVQLFTQSSLSTLTVEVDPTLLYQHYFYKSGTSQPYVEHCEEMFWFVNCYLFLEPGDNILDIGGNDGTLLKTFLRKKPGLNVLNIDASSNLTAEAQREGIPSLNAFWNADLARSLDKKFKLITTTNCFQHTAPIESFVEGISLSLDKLGIWCLEFPYWLTSLNTKQFDQVYHEHLYYYLLEPITLLLKKYNLRPIKALRYSIHGGTLRVLIGHDNGPVDAWQPCSSVEEILAEERYLKILSYTDWGKLIKRDILECKQFILSLKESGHTIAGFGAAAKGCTFLNAAELDYRHIEFVIDDTNIKQGKFIPGTGIEIVSREILKVVNVDYIVILAHNFADYIIKLLKQNGYKGKFIVFLPKLKVYD